MSDTPTFQKLIEEEKKKMEELQNMQVSKQNGGKRRRTRTKKRRVKKTKRKMRTRKYKRRSTKKRRSIKRRRKTKNHRRRQRGGLEPVIPSQLQARMEDLINKHNDGRTEEKKVPRTEVADHIKNEIGAAAAPKAAELKKVMEKTDVHGNSLPTRMKRMGFKTLGHTGRENQRAAVRAKMALGLDKKGAIQKLAQSNAAVEVGRNLAEHVSKAVNNFDEKRQIAAAQEEGQERLVADRTLGDIKRDAASAATREQIGKLGDAVNPGDRLVKAYGKGGGRRRKRSNSRTHHKKRSGRRTCQQGC